MEDHVADWARVEAAKQNVSLSRMLGDILAQKMRHDDAYERAYQEWKVDHRSFKSDGSPYAQHKDIYAERLTRIR